MTRFSPATAHSSAASLHLLQLVSSGLPVGAYTYSQGLEWAVEKGWVDDRHRLGLWLTDILFTSMTYLEVPVFYGLYKAMENHDPIAAERWAATLIAHRETSELRTEEQQRGRSMMRILSQFDLDGVGEYSKALQQSQLSGFALAVKQWNIDPGIAMEAWLWSWLENAVLAGIKIIPLGQSEGQRLLFEITREIPGAVMVGKKVKAEHIGFSCVAQAIASSRHETQYTRLYRS